MCLLRVSYCILIYVKSIIISSLNGRAKALAVSRWHSPQRHGFDPTSVLVRFVVNEVILRHVLLRVIRFSPVSSSPVSSSPPVLHTLFVYILTLREGQASDAWEPSKKESSFGNRGPWDSRILSIFCCFWKIISHEGESQGISSKWCFV